MLKEFLKAENSGGEISSVVKFVRSGAPSAAFGVSFAEKCHIACALDTPFLYIVKDGFYGAKIKEELAAMLGEEVVYLPPKDDVLLYKTAFDKTRYYERLEAIYKIQSGAKYVVATTESLLQLFPKKLPSITIERGQTLDPYELASFLVKCGYKRREFAEDKASFALRGDIFEIYPVGSQSVYRIDFFGDEIETVTEYVGGDKENKKTVAKVTVISATDATIRKEDADGIKTRLKESLSKFKTLLVKDDARRIVSELTEKIDEGETGDELQFLMPVLPTVTDDPLSFFSKDTVVIFDECKMIADNLSAIIKEHTERVLTLSRTGRALDFTILQLADSNKLIKRFAEFKELALQNLTTTIPFFNPLKTFAVKSTPVARYSAKIEDLFRDVKNWKFTGYKIVVCCGSGARAEKIADAFAEQGIPALRSDGDGVRFGMVQVSSFFLPTGLISHEAKLVLIGTGDLFLDKPEEKKIKKKRGDLFQAPEVGDFAVHEIHGVGYVTGVKRITTQDGSKDYVAVQYQGGDMLYVGVDQMDRLTKYVGGDKPALNKIGGKEFDRIKQRVKASIAEMTINLKQLYKLRKEKKGFAFSPDTSLSDEFDEQFEFEATDDQLQSEAEIKADMESDKVMDRLLCGDVGFGKTEVAFRAAFKAITDGKQVALVCPTTILCEQHYRAALSRFKNFGIRIAALNRFKTQKQAESTIKGLIDGDIDFVIGTHALFNKEVKFKDLGLLILDEEQRFGVEHKEKLKLLKDNVDTLTMTATPIPRTLHMSLSGIRDISTISTPPKVRIPVQTYVTEESDALIVDAVRRELSREGQVLILYNRVETIYKFSEHVRELLPDAKIITAHGRMDKRALEDSVMSFYDEKYNVMIATTIIENGIDLPKANTLIVIDADRLGLSTLYQLKGRVGRSNVMAHAYFTFKREKVLSDTAYKRLSALMEFTEMGSGYKIALRDLEIRGAGNVLGREQHGHMDKIGYELYNKLLKESLGETVKDYDTELDVNMDAYIPEEYISTPPSRMDCYKQIAEIKTAEDENRVRSSLEENYGKVPVEVDNLILIAKLKNAARRKGAIKVGLNKSRAYVVLNGLDSLKSGGLLDRINAEKEDVKLSFTDNPVIDFYASTDTRATAEYMLDFLQ